MNQSLLSFSLLILAFFIGSIPLGLLIARGRGVDIRKLGSGNIGATNVHRVLGRKAGIQTLIGDILKGILAVCLGWVSAFFGLQPELNLSALLGLAAILGHCFSPFLNFKGGKGVAVALGVFLVTAPLESLCSIAVFLTAVRTSGYVSLGSLTAVAFMPLSVALFPLIFGEPSVAKPPYTLLSAVLGAALIWFRHRENIGRLLNGKEPKFFRNS